MTHVHYKFFSKLSYNTVVHDGPNITLQDLKRQIMDMEKLRVGYCDLQITNAQTKQDEEGAIPKGSSVIVRRIPIVGVKSGMNSKTRNIGKKIHLNSNHVNKLSNVICSAILESYPPDGHRFPCWSCLIETDVGSQFAPSVFGHSTQVPWKPHPGVLSWS
uniref:E3 ubiquitin-protein ligase RBBP6-like n=1 Tax=Labrus bergylta TaxID=56723 RepID=A0A3Q3G2W0_9LABR